MLDDPTASEGSESLQAEVLRLRLLHSISQEFTSSLDFDELLPKVFNCVLSAVGAQGGSIWIADGGVLRCRLAAGAASQNLVGSEVPIGDGFVGDVAQKQRSTIVTRAMEDSRFQEHLDRSSTMVTLGVLAAPMVVKGETVGSIQVANKVTGDGIFDEGDRQLLEGLASSAAVALRNAQLHTAEKRAHDLALLLEISREVTSTLDLDHILQSVVNLATRAISFETGAVALRTGGGCEIRAVAGVDKVDAKAPPIRSLKDRALWAQERGKPFYLADRDSPLEEDEQLFVNAFENSLRSAGIRSVLYLPLSDEEGMLGVLMFEAAKPDFAGDTQREMTAILANQTAVALRNAELYNQVPLVDMFGAIARKKKKLLAVPGRRLAVYATAAVALIAAATLIRWPLRITGINPTFRAAGYSEVRPIVSGVIERVFVSEGAVVSRGDPLFQLRATELRAESTATALALRIAEREGARAQANRDAATELLQRARSNAFREQLALLNDEIAATTVRAPVSGVVFTPRPHELTGTRPAAGETVLSLGRTDTLELGIGVRQRDMDRIAVGQRVRLRVDALPQRTFEGRVTFIPPLPLSPSSAGTAEVLFAVRAMVPNPDGLLRPGMAAKARILTARTSVLGRLTRRPSRWLRLLWWRLKP